MGPSNPNRWLAIDLGYFFHPPHLYYLSTMFPGKTADLGNKVPSLVPPAGVLAPEGTKGEEGLVRPNWAALVG